jgi:asparagine synthase (glutamine-hydrolysing)
MQGLQRPEGVLTAMAAAIRHRGPDGEGLWWDECAGIGLAHRRLAIVDLSEAGHQPMQSHNERYVLAFNGEIYNHTELQAELEYAGVGAWIGHSDTEILLEAIALWGVQAALQRAVGMFALAVWDRQLRVLTLARDRIGEKPLYYGMQNGCFVFGSELKALRAFPGFTGEIDRDALCLYLRHNYIPAPYSIYRNIHKLQPGCYLTIDERYSPQIETYWDAARAIADGQRRIFAGSEQDAADHLESLLRQSLFGQMMADVPLGAFLSGGVDSSAIAALMQTQSSRPVKTFSIGFHESGYDEAQYAREVARHLGTDHTELYVTAQQALNVIPKLPQIYDEPFADSSQIPTFLLMQMARRHVTVALSGDGGDELFCGYNRYLWTAKLWSGLQKVPRAVRQPLAKGVSAISVERWNTIMRYLPMAASSAHWGDKLHKGAGVLASPSLESLYRGLVSHWPDPQTIVFQGSEPSTVLSENRLETRALSAVARMMAWDLVSYLPDDILVKVDRAAMAVSLETRVPFLDHRVIEFAWQLPHQYKYAQGVGKKILRQVLYRHVPRELIERPKMGFGIPLDDWLRGPLREWAEELLEERRLRDQGFFDPVPIRQKWREQLSGQRRWAYHLWDILMFQAWLEQERS